MLSSQSATQTHITWLNLSAGVLLWEIMTGGRRGWGRLWELKLGIGRPHAAALRLLRERKALPFRCPLYISRLSFDNHA